MPDSRLLTLPGQEQELLAELRSRLSSNGAPMQAVFKELPRESISSFLSSSLPKVEQSAVHELDSTTTQAAVRVAVLKVLLSWLQALGDGRAQLRESLGLPTDSAAQASHYSADEQKLNSILSDIHGPETPSSVLSRGISVDGLEQALQLAKEQTSAHKQRVSQLQEENQHLADRIQEYAAISEDLRAKLQRSEASLQQALHAVQNDDVAGAAALIRDQALDRQALLSTRLREMRVRWRTVNKHLRHWQRSALQSRQQRDAEQTDKQLAAARKQLDSVMAQGIQTNSLAEKSFKRELMSRFLSSWSRQTTRTSRRRLAIGRFIIQRQESTIRKFISHWGKEAAHGLRDRHFIAFMFGLLQRRHISKVLVAWHVQAASDKRVSQEQMVQLKLVSSMQSWKSQVLETVFRVRLLSRWRLIAVQRKHRSAAIRKTVMSSMLEPVAKAFSAWRISAAAQSRFRSQLRRHLSKWQARHMESSIQAWYACAKQERSQRRQVANLWFKRARMTCLRSLLGWYFIPHTSVEIGKALCAYSARRKQSAALCKFYEWQLAVKKAKAIKQVLVRIMKRPMASAFVCWLQLVEASKSERRIRLEKASMALKSIMAMQNNSLAVGFQAWIAGMAQLKREKLVLQKVIARFQNRLLAASFERFHDSVHASIRMKQVATKIIGRWLHGAMSSAFNQWIDAVEEIKREKEVERAEQQRTDAILKRVITIMQNRAVVSAFQTWADHLAKSKHAHSLLARVRARLVNLQAAAAFATWRDNASEASRVKSLMTRVAARFRMASVVITFDCWHTFVAEKREKLLLEEEQEQKLEAALRRATKIHYVRSCKKVISAWFSRTTTSKREKQIMARVVSRLQHSSTGMMFAAWAEKVQHTKKVKQFSCGILKRLLNMTSYRAFTTWSDNVANICHQRDVVQRVMTRMKNQSVVMAFDRWIEAISIIRHENEVEALKAEQQNAVIAKVLKIWLARDMNAAFTSWKEHVAQQIYNRAVMKRVAARMQSSSLFKVFNRWQDNVSTIQHQRAVVSKCISRFRNGLVATAFSMWTAFIQQAEHDRIEKEREEKFDAVIAGVLRMWLRRRVRACTASCFAKWSEIVQAKRHKIELTRRVMFRLQHASVARSFRQWYHQILNTRHVQRVMRSVIQRLAQRAVYCAFESWKERVQQSKSAQKSLQKVVFMIQNKQSLACLGHWKRQAEFFKHQRMILSKVRAAFLLRTSRAAFLSWAANAQQLSLNKARLSRVMAIMQNRTAAAAFSQWQVSVSELCRQRAVVGKVAGRLRLMGAAAAMSRWCEVIAETKRQRGVMSRVISMLQHGGLMRCFSRWAGMVAESKEETRKTDRASVILGRVAAIWTGDARRQMLQAWAVHVEEQRRMRDVGRKVIKRLQAGRLYSAFAKWVHAIDEINSEKEAAAEAERRAAGAMAKAVRVWHYRGLSSALLGWKLRVNEQRRARGILEKVVRRMRDRRVTVAMNSWISFVTFSQQHKHAVASRLQSFARSNSRFLLVSFLRAWSSFAHQSISVRKAASILSGKLSRAAVVSIFMSWHHKAASLKRARQAASMLCCKSRSAVQREHLSAWRSRAILSLRQISHKQSITCVVEAGNAASSHIVASRMFSFWKDAYCRSSVEKLSLQAKALESQLADLLADKQSSDGVSQVAIAKLQGDLEKNQLTLQRQKKLLSQFAQLQTVQVSSLKDELMAVKRDIKQSSYSCSNNVQRVFTSLAKSSLHICHMKQALEEQCGQARESIHALERRSGELLRQKDTAEKEVESVRVQTSTVKQQLDMEHSKLQDASSTMEGVCALLANCLSEIGGEGSSLKDIEALAGEVRRQSVNLFSSNQDSQTQVFKLVERVHSLEHELEVAGFKAASQARNFAASRASDRLQTMHVDMGQLLAATGARFERDMSDVQRRLSQLAVLNEVEGRSLEQLGDDGLDIEESENKLMERLRASAMDLLDSARRMWMSVQTEVARRKMEDGLHLADESSTADLFLASSMNPADTAGSRSPPVRSNGFGQFPTDGRAGARHMGKSPESPAVTGPLSTSELHHISPVQASSRQGTIAHKHSREGDAWDGVVDAFGLKGHIASGR